MKPEKKGATRHSKGKKGKQPKLGQMDERFAQVLTDPRFRTLKRHEKKVKIDSRFKRMFTDKKFRLKSDLDIRGRPIESKAEDLSKVYELSDEEEDKDVDKPETSKAVKKPSKIPDCRGLDNEELSSSSSDESDDDDKEEQIDHKWAELDKDVPREDKTSSRLAVCNVDWDRIKAVDLFVLFNSFKPDNGTVISVKVFASEFGKKRMTEEAVQGPAEIVKETPVIEEEDDGIEHDEADAEMEEFMTEKLRQYQLNRLKYYYAVVECDSQATASVIYDELDGYEYESSATTLDVRFIPDDMNFEDEPTQECSTPPDLAAYKAPIFITTALQQSKVQLTWDETDPSRKEKIEGAFAAKDEKALDDLEAFLASGSESDDEDGSSQSDHEEQAVEEVKKTKSFEDKINKYKLLLQTAEEEDGKQDEDIEITFDDDGNEVDTNEKNEDDSEEESGDNSENDDDSESEPDPEPPKNKKGQKRKIDSQEDESRDPQRQELGLLIMDDEDAGKSHFNYNKLVEASSSKTKKKKLADKISEDNFHFEAEDPRFGKIFTAPEYNIDPSDPHFKKTPAMEELIRRKAKSGKVRQREQETQSKRDHSAVAQPSQQPKLDPSLSSMIASIKSNTQRMSTKKKGN